MDKANILKNVNIEKEAVFTLNNGEILRGIISEIKESHCILDETTAFGDMVVVKYDDIKAVRNTYPVNVYENIAGSYYAEVRTIAGTGILRSTRELNVTFSIKDGEFVLIGGDYINCGGWYDLESVEELEYLCPGIVEDLKVAPVQKR